MKTFLGGGGSPTRWLAIGMVLGGIALIALTGAWIYQTDIHDSKQNDFEMRTANVQLLDKAGEEAAAAADLLKQYVKTGDESLIPQIREHVSTSVDTAATAKKNGTVIDLEPIALAGAQLAQGVGKVVALRQSGDVQAAAATLESLAKQFEEVKSQGKEIVDAERQEALTLEDSAGHAADIAGGLFIALLAAAALFALSTIGLIVRSLFGRRSRPAASSA